MARGSVRGQRSLATLALPESHWKQLHGVRRPGRPDARIDHVLVGPSGVYAIKYWSSDAGQIIPHSTLVHDGAVDAVTTEVLEAACAVGNLLPSRYRSRTRPVLCLRDDEPLADLGGEVMFTSLIALEHILRSSPVVLSTSEVAEVFARLRSRLETFPVLPAAPRRTWSRRRRLTAWLAAAAAMGGVVGGAVALVPELVAGANLG